MDLILAACGLTSFFPVTVSADEVTRGKPAPDVYACVLRRVGAAADRCLVVEDSAAGIRAGLAAGIQVVSVRTGRTVDHPRFVGAFADLATLADFLEERAA
jgi:sugar-phosphatase